MRPGTGTLIYKKIWISETRGVPMDVTLINSVIMAQDYETLVEWYRETLELDIKLKVDKDYKYTDLAKNGKLVIGFAQAEEKDYVPTRNKNNTMIMQISVSDIHLLFERIKNSGGTIMFGPSVDRNEGFKFGAFKDIEGNQVWVIENFKFD